MYPPDSITFSTLRLEDTLLDRFGEEDNPEEAALESVLLSALTEIRHLCDHRGLDLYGLFDRSYKHYLMELPQVLAEREEAQP